mmetsp:Transcript_41523/g.90002  ORF Transcript_41523/g.90002 Transcript_41523/m.90002 type:complete len:120 (+) Transcript_41523:1308-1667(+)
MTCSQAKLATPVAFPCTPSGLDLSPFASPDIPHQPPPVYTLCGMCCHEEHGVGGHYIAVTKHGGEWYTFNDSVVDPGGLETAKTGTPYLLFYQRDPKPQPQPRPARKEAVGHVLRPLPT